jgi:uncharacterized repeat protein (TIGR02543 family)
MMLMRDLKRVRSLVAVSLLLVVLLVPVPWASGDARLLQQGDEGGATPGPAPDGLVSVSGTVEATITQSSDDAEERLDTGQVYLKGKDLELGTDEGSGGTTLSMMVGLRFEGLGVPQGATITSAFIEFTASEVQEGATSVTVLGEASDNAQTYKDDPSSVSTRPPVAASVAWNAIPPWNSPGAKYLSADLKAVVQQIVNRPGWRPRNAMAFMIAGSGRRTAYSWDGSPLLAPKLIINYEGQVQCQTLTRLSNPSGTGQITVDPAPNCGASQYFQGTTVQLTAVPTGTNYYFGGWSGGASGSSNPTSVVMDADQVVTANFLQGTCYTLTMIVDPVVEPTAGEIRPSPEPDCGDGTKAGKYKSGTVVLVDVAVRGGWQFTGWSGDLTGTDKPQPLLMDANKSVTASFVPTCRRIKMTIDPPAGGTVQYSPAPNCPPGDYWQPDTVVQLRAIPAAGHFFVKFKGDVPGGETYDNPISVTMDSNKSFDAVFRSSSNFMILLPAVRKRSQ